MADRLISAEELHNALRKQQRWIVKREGFTNEGYSYDQVHFAIDGIPTVDAVPVVRCKDCRFYIQSNEKCELVDTRLRFYETDKTWTGDCFCSWGERREDD